MVRDTIFISHANPEDNEFTLWLALQLASQGYAVWCDLTELLGGEDWWKNIDRIIRERAQKFIYVLSRTSNEKDGPRQELAVARNTARDHGLRDFIIPVHIDDLPHRAMMIELGLLNATEFKRGWAQGLANLLQKLEDDELVKKPNFNPDAVTSWWRQTFSADAGVVARPEVYPSNWFPIRALPPDLYYHKLRRAQNRVPCAADSLPCPAINYADGILSFAPARDIIEAQDGGILVELSLHWPTDEFLDGTADILFIPRRERRKVMHRLVRVAWEYSVGTRRLPTHQMANEACCVYFTDADVEKGKAFFTGLSGKRTYRSLIGYKNIKRGADVAYKRHWHFGIELKPLLYPEIAFIVRPHVLFSFDGRKLWEDDAKSHSARRSQCKDWWNPHWRDRILAAMTHLADDDGLIRIPVAAQIAIEVESSPLMFTSPVSHTLPDDAGDVAVIGEDDGAIGEEQEEDGEA